RPEMDLTVTIDEYTEGDEYITGTVGKDVIELAIIVDGMFIPMVANDGKYKYAPSSYDIKDRLKAGAKIEAAAINYDNTIRGPKVSTIVQKRPEMDLT
ncbi:immunoglobulin-like domain-containing protein, partial [Enterococcus faecium]|uniref:immunoglobulin-like domain-containing protein n=1 Tax=Enterococcus faecium TaxID=1352 RepID=UPI0015E2C9F7